MIVDENWPLVQSAARHATCACWREWPLTENFHDDRARERVAALGHRGEAPERQLISVLQSSTREGPLRIIEPPFLAADRSAVNDPRRAQPHPGQRHCLW